MEGRFPEVKEIKQLIRDQIDPDMDLGHSDSNHENDITEDIDEDDIGMDDDAAEEARRYFGVM